MITAAIQGRKHRQLHQVGSCWWHAYILIYPDIDQPLEKKTGKIDSDYLSQRKLEG
jgi:hypothetical protein